MATTTLSLHSQAVFAYDGASDIATTGLIWSGLADLMASPANASALRFNLPGDFDSATAVESATLNLYARYYDSEAANQRHRVGILAATPQVLPSTGSAVYSAPIGSAVRTLGLGTYSPALDVTLTATLTWHAIDLTDAVNEAIAANRLSGGSLIVLVQPLNYGYGAYIGAHGINLTNPATLSLDYYSASPPPLGPAIINRGRINRGRINAGLIG